MKVMITGGAGFLGRQLARRLAQRGRLTDAAGRERVLTRIICFDQVVPNDAAADPALDFVAGDIADPAALAAALGSDTASVFHLAAVVSGAAEADFDLGLRVNLDGTRALLDACRRLPQPPKLVFASSLAVYGGALPPVVTDEVAPAPQSSYGVQKFIGELLLGDCTRKGYLDGRALRLPTIVVRPGRPNAAASSFASGILREPLAGVDAICPVPLDSALWLASPEAALAGLIHAHELPAAGWRAATRNRALNLPGLTVTVGEMLEALRAVGGEAARARVHLQPDARIAAIVGTWPARFDTRAARELGFAGDADFAQIVRAYAQAHPAAGVSATQSSPAASARAGSR
jgi:nucleoside-diphosphate-sugar epimerase